MNTQRRFVIPRVWQWAAVLCALSLPRIAYACQGRPGTDPIAPNVRLAYIYAAWTIGFAAVACVLAWRGRRWHGIATASLLCAVLQPAWYVSVVRGDCGDLRRALAFAAMLLAAALIVVQLVQARFRGRLNADVRA